MSAEARAPLPTPPPGDAAGGAAAAVPPYQAERVAALDDFLARCDRLATPHTLPFHATVWLRAWYDTLGCIDGREPLLLAVRDGRSGADLVLLPLVLRRHRGLRTVEFADAEVVDYTVPLLAPGWHGGADERTAAAALWQALRPALQGGDVWHIHKMLGDRLDAPQAGRNPLMHVLPVQPCELFGNEFTAPQGWEAWRHSLDKTVRKEIERCWRVFQRSPQARFEQVDDLATARALFDVLERQQRERMVGAGQRYVLDQPAYRAFYRRLIEDGLPGGQVVLTALRDGEAVVSALFGVASGVRYVALRQSVGDAAWRHVSPGRLLHEQTARSLHAQGRSHLDFGIGDYRHKAMFKLVRIPLYDACVALSWRGRAVVALWHVRRWLKRRPAVRAAWQRLRRMA